MYDHKQKQQTFGKRLHASKYMYNNKYNEIEILKWRETSESELQMWEREGKKEQKKNAAKGFSSMV